MERVNRSSLQAITLDGGYRSSPPLTTPALRSEAGNPRVYMKTANPRVFNGGYTETTNPSAYLVVNGGSYPENPSVIPASGHDSLIPDVNEGHTGPAISSGYLVFDGTSCPAKPVHGYYSQNPIHVANFSHAAVSTPLGA